MDTSIDMICEESLPMEHTTPKPTQSTLFTEAMKTNLTPATMPSSSAGNSPSYSERSSLAPSDYYAPTSMAHHHLQMPSPSHSRRSRIDPRYAARLPRMHVATTSMVVSDAAAAASSTPFVKPPPLVQRCEHADGAPTSAALFRPTPIVTPMVARDPCNEFSRDNSNNSISLTPTSKESPGHRWTPRKPPLKRVKSEYGDRFIPRRSTSNVTFNLWEGLAHRSARNSSNNSNNDFLDNASEHSNRSNNGASTTATATNTANNTTANHPDSTSTAAATAAAAAAAAAAGNDSQSNPNSSHSFATSTQRNLLRTLLRTEVMGENDDPRSQSNRSNTIGNSSRNGGGNNSIHNNPSTNHLRFTSRTRMDFRDNVYDPTSVVNAFRLSPVTSAASEQLITAPSKRKRRISKVPFKVLDAPALQDDFYLNLVDWSSQNVLAVGLCTCVYLWSACTSKVTKLCDFTATEDTVTAVAWAQRGTHLAVGTNKGEVQLWDTVKCKKVRTMTGHTARVGTLAWTGPILASGSRDRLIYMRDVRVQAPFTDRLSNHRQEVCGLKWSFEEPSFLASGGNDNNLHVIDSRNPNEPLHKFTEHTAAVKAIAWSPHQHGLLASGGGTADRCIRFWNTLSGSSLNKIDTGSQVCNLAWSQNCNEIVSTHGYSLNQIVVWRYPSMSKVTTLTGHTYRVLYLAMSPDGSTVVTGAGDETLRFWQIFPGPRSDGKDSAGGLLFPNTLGSVIR